jgi:hypothetical protein
MVTDNPIVRIITVLQEKHWCKASKGVQARNAASEDELIDIWWQDILINISMVNWFLPELYITYEWTDEIHCSLWTLIGMLEIIILLVISLWSWLLIATDIHVYNNLQSICVTHDQHHTCVSVPYYVNT